MKFEIPSRYIDEHLVTRRKHPVYDLWIYNYTPEVQFSRLWDEITLACRGLILDADDNIIARPPSKFFNYGEPDVIIPDSAFTITEKVDGSLIIVTRYNNELIFSSRGSFESDQALEARKIWKEKRYYRKNFLFDSGSTYLFEIIYPENRIVVDYGNARKLIGISWCKNDVGKYYDFPKGHGFPVVKQHKERYLSDLFAKLNDPIWHNKEGYVIRFENGTHVKAKYAEYMRLHKIVTNLSELAVWELLKDGKELELGAIPDEFYNWYKETRDRLQQQFDDIKNIVKDAVANINKSTYDNRKELALVVLTYRFSSLIFSAIDGRDYDQSIWKLIRPDNNV